MTILFTITREDGSKKRFKPISKRRLKAQHVSGRCWWLCSYCDADMQEWSKSKGGQS